MSNIVENTAVPLLSDLFYKRSLDLAAQISEALLLNWFPKERPPCIAKWKAL